MSRCFCIIRNKEEDNDFLLVWWFASITVNKKLLLERFVEYASSGRSDRGNFIYNIIKEYDINRKTSMNLWDVPLPKDVLKEANVLVVKS